MADPGSAWPINKGLSQLEVCPLNNSAKEDMKPKAVMSSRFQGSLPTKPGST